MNDFVVGGKRFQISESRECRVVLKPVDFDTLLSLNTSNRPISENWVSELASRMKEGKWKYNGDAIRVSVSGVLLNGQHTLTAARRVGKPLEALVVTGLPDETWVTIDDGRKRGFSQYLGKQNIPNYTSAAALCHITWKYHNMSFGNGYNERGDMSDMESEYSGDPDIAESAHELTVCKALKQLGSTSVTFTLWAAKKALSPEKYAEFKGQLSGTVATKAGDPVYELKDRLINQRIQKYKLPMTDMFAFGVKTVNAFKAGKVIRDLSFRSRVPPKDGTEKRAPSLESFPEINGYPPRCKKA
jgi:hypothetical protein